MTTVPSEINAAAAAAKSGSPPEKVTPMMAHYLRQTFFDMFASCE